MRTYRFSVLYVFPNTTILLFLLSSSFYFVLVVLYLKKKKKKAYGIIFVFCILLHPMCSLGKVCFLNLQVKLMVIFIL